MEDRLGTAMFGKFDFLIKRGLEKSRSIRSLDREYATKRENACKWSRRKTMAVNLRLTHAVKDRAVQSFQLNASELLISFADGSTMTVTIAECNSPPLQEGARIRQISEDQAKILFECEDESTLDVTIVDPGNSVIVRDKSGQVEYLG
jgi:hypothetical protein